MSIETLSPFKVGDLLVARKPMRAWVSDAERGTAGTVIVPGEQALVVETWLVGHHRRLRLLRKDRMLLFSCLDHTIFMNWALLSTTQG